jgi:hypothetical protein
MVDLMDESEEPTDPVRALPEDVDLSGVLVTRRDCRTFMRFTDQQGVELEVGVNDRTALRLVWNLVMIQLAARLRFIP